MAEHSNSPSSNKISREIRDVPGSSCWATNLPGAFLQSGLAVVIFLVGKRSAHAEVLPLVSRSSVRTPRNRHVYREETSIEGRYRKIFDLLFRKLSDSAN